MTNNEARKVLQEVWRNERIDYESVEVKEAIDRAIKALQERSKGEWIKFPTNHSIIQCSECTALLNNLRVDVFKDKIGKMNFCPNCGASMRG